MVLLVLLVLLTLLISANGIGSAGGSVSGNVNMVLFRFQARL